MGPCAKVQVHCLLILRDRRVFEGSNACVFPQPVCPRLPGEDYRKCRDVCGQPNHAETAALMRARAVASPAEIEGASVYVAYNRVCDQCAATLARAGITDIVTTSTTA
jgi:tRNA(Arg) A34 adenosine deaminase TadA